MKNIKVLYEPEEIRAHFRKTFKTELFRTEMDKKGSFINMIVERAARYPMFIYEFSDHPAANLPDRDKTEWAFLGGWMSGINQREYGNPAVQDTYYLHELYHKGFVTSKGGLTLEGWKDKMFRNELNASMASEIELYMHHPEFRKETFDQEIFADRFLRDEATMKRWKDDPIGERDELRLRRRDLMLRENKADPVEYWIHKFAEQNVAWAAIWSRRYDQVEVKMEELHRAIDDGVPRKEAMDKYMTWLMSPEVTQGTQIPFPDEAVAFAGVYRLNNKHYQQSIAAGDLGHGHKGKQLLAHHYPGQAPEATLKGRLAEEVLGKRPDWAKGRENYFMSPATAMYAGNFAVLFAPDPAKASARAGKAKPEDILVVIQKRADKGPNGEDRFGLFGGFANLDKYNEAETPNPTKKGEQPPEACAREIREESVNDKGKPILDIDPTRIHKILRYGYDQRSEPGTVFAGFEVKLKPAELAAITAHSKRMECDSEYAAAVHAASNNEVLQIIVKPLSEVLALGKGSFTHPHEFEALEKFAEQLRGKERSGLA